MNENMNSRNPIQQDKCLSSSACQDILNEFSAKIFQIFTIAPDQYASASSLISVLTYEEKIADGIWELAKQRITNIDISTDTLIHALEKIGVINLRNIAVEYMFSNLVIQRFQIEGFDSSHFWQHCVSVATIARNLARIIHFRLEDEAWFAGLFHDVGQLYLISSGTEEYNEFLSSAQDTEISFAEQERSLFGTGHDEFGANFLEKCGFSNQLVVSVKHHHQDYDEKTLGLEGARLTALLQLSDFVAWSLGFGSFKGVSTPVLPPQTRRIISLKRLGISRLFKMIEPHLQRNFDIYGIPMPSDNMVKEKLFHVNVELGRLRTRYLYLMRKHNNYLEKANEIYSKHAKILMTPHQSLERNLIFKNTLRTVRENLGLKDIMVFGFNQESRSIAVCEYPGATPFDSSCLGKVVRVDENDSNILACLRSRKGVRIQGVTPAEREILNLLNAHWTIMIPIVGAGNIHGLVCLVDKTQEDMDDPEMYAPLNLLFHEMAMALDNASLYASAKRRANQDKLTGVLSRAALDESFSLAFRQASQRGEDFCIAVVDIDFFKKINDKFGHLQGDRVLRLVARVLKTSLRAGSILGRYGGEEFVIILKRTGLQAACRCCERMRLRVENLGKTLSKKLPDFRLTISIGLAEFQSDLKNAVQLFDMADNALYRAKNSGRNQVACHQSKNALELRKQ
ncbi:MAG: diguanylate cyclase [Magnetococcales bacterium]|nr:diguanylate cyclase [Magnetococcales bacterium]